MTFNSLNVKMPKYILKEKGQTAIETITNMMLGIEKNYTQ